MAGYYARFTRWVRQSAVYTINGAAGVDEAKEIATDVPDKGLSWNNDPHIKPIARELDMLVEFNDAGLASKEHIRYMTPELDLYFINAEFDGDNFDLHVLAEDPQKAFDLWEAYYNQSLGFPLVAGNPFEGDIIKKGGKPELTIYLAVIDTSAPHALGWHQKGQMEAVAFMYV